MSDPEAAGAVTDDAAALAAEASGGDAGGVAGPSMKEVAENATGADEPAGLMEALFHTDPDADPSDVDGPAFVGEFVVGVQKIMDAMGVETGGGGGTPAIVNLFRGALGARAFVAAKTADESDDSEPEVSVR